MVGLLDQMNFVTEFLGDKNELPSQQNPILFIAEELPYRCPEMRNKSNNTLPFNRKL